MILDVQGQALSFGAGTALGVGGQSQLYSNVITIGGQAVDAVVTLGGVSNATLTALDSTTNPFATPAAGSYLQPNLQINAVGGSATFTISFIAGGSYGQSATPTGEAITLRNVLVNAYDLDGSGGSQAGRQFVQFSDVGGYTLAGTTSITPSYLAGVGTSFVTTVGGNVTAAAGTTAADAIRVRAAFDDVSTMTVAFGDRGATGVSYFALDFGPGPAFVGNAVAVDVKIASGTAPLVTSEAGASASFSVTLASAPTANVVVTLAGDDPTEGVLSTRTLVFTPTNWSIAQQVTVSGVDDLTIDGDVGYTLRATASSVGDARFNGVGALIDIVNVENDGPVGPLLGSLDIANATDTGANDLVTANQLPTLTFAAGPGLTVSLLGALGQPLDPAQFTVSYSAGLYTIQLLDADPVRQGIQPFGSFSGSVSTQNVPNALDGTYTVHATDVAGISAQVGSFVIDTTPPSTTISGIDISDDLGDPTDFVTGVAQQTISATLSAALAPDEVLLGSVDGGLNWFDVSGYLTGRSLNWTGPDVTLLAGQNTIQLKVVDLAGNQGVVAGQNYEIDSPLYLVTTPSTQFSEGAITYTDPNTVIEFSYFGTVNEEAVYGTRFNDFIALGDGDDAANGGEGDDVIDGGAGSNFLVGGAGRDIFFVDVRNSEVTWSTIADWSDGEELAIWGWRDGISTWSWNAAPDGTPSYQGATLVADVDGDGTIETKITWTGLSPADIRQPTATTVSGNELLWFT